MQTTERDWKEVAENLSRRLADDFITEHKRAEELESTLNTLARLIMNNPQEARMKIMDLGWCLKCNCLHHDAICDAEDWS